MKPPWPWTDARCTFEKEGLEATLVGQPFQGARLGDPPASARRVLSARACSPSCATVDSIRKVHKAIIRECARSTGGTRPSRTTGPLPHCHPPRLRLLEISARVMP